MKTKHTQIHKKKQQHKCWFEHKKTKKNVVSGAECINKQCLKKNAITCRSDLQQETLKTLTLGALNV